MKKVKVLINKSVKGDMTYNIYRFKNEAAKKDLNYYLDIDPIATINENDENIEEGVLLNVEPMYHDDGEEYTYMILSISFDFVYKDNFFTINLINSVEIIERKLEVYVGKTGIKEILVKRLINGSYENEIVITDKLEINDIIVLESNNSIKINKKISNYYAKIKFNINTKKVIFIDNNADGLYKPIYKPIEKMEEFELFPDINSQKNIYNYTTIATNSELKVSEISNISTIEVKENPNNIKTVIECSDNYCDNHNSDSSTWEKIDEIYSTNAYKIKKNDMYSREIPDFNIREIYNDDSNVELYSERLLNIPNIWHTDKLYMLYRKQRAYRFTNVFNERFSQKSDVFYIENLTKINIDKMVIYKKRVTYLDEDERKEPISPSDSEAQLLMIYVRIGGIYYADAIENIDKQPIEIVTNKSRLPFLKIKDNCLYSNHYNYTIYLYDEKGKKSKPYSIVI